MQITMARNARHDKQSSDARPGFAGSGPAQQGFVGLHDAAIKRELLAREDYRANVERVWARWRGDT